MNLNKNDQIRKRVFSYQQQSANNLVPTNVQSPRNRKISMNGSISIDTNY
jgi:hypothetical protein